MELTIRPMTRPERMYCYAQSQQISMQTGLIGYLRADMGSNGEDFFSAFYDFRASLKTEAFKAEFDAFIHALRFDDGYGGVLKDRRALGAYCRRSPESSMGSGNYGFRADTAEYAYLLRLNPNKGMYNLYCYCYQKKWLDRHLNNAEKGIRFVDPHYRDLFRLEDGDSVKILTASGENLECQCRYIDEAHVEVGQNLYHICEFAERMEHSGNQVIPLRASLPERCYSNLLDTGMIVILKRGETGYYKTDIPYQDKAEAKAIVEERNNRAGITKAQAEAMKAGSVFGFHVPAADPKNYDDNGQPIRPKGKDRGDAR